MTVRCIAQGHAKLGRLLCRRPSPVLISNSIRTCKTVKWTGILLLIGKPGPLSAKVLLLRDVTLTLVPADIPAKVVVGWFGLFFSKAIGIKPITS